VGFSPSGLLAEETAADSHYHSLQASLTQRFHHGLRFLASYTFSKSIDDTSGGSTSIFSEITGDEAHIWTSKARSDFDRPQRLVVNFGYEIPRWGFHWNDTAVGKKLFSGWQISGIGIWQSGTPFSITDSSGAGFYGTTGSRARWATNATVSSAALSSPVESRLNVYFNTTAFVKAGNVFGNTGRNILSGPAQRNVDFALSKRFAIREPFNAEFRSEFFNVFNMVSFANPASNIAASNFGVISSTVGNPRVIQFAFKLLF
jgi:hypothetical protein